jgi:pilus assembly protein CpaE
MRSRTRILLVEPEPTRQEALRRQLELLGPAVSVTLVGSYGEAPAMAAAHDLVLLVADRGEDGAIALVHGLRDVAPRTPVVAGSYEHDARRLLHFLRAGCRDCLLLPTTSDELRELVMRVEAREKAHAADEGRLVAVVGASGGVGCTTVALGLAQCLARDPGRRVVLADFDFAHGTLAASLGLEPELTLADLSRAALRIDATVLQNALARHRPSGLGVLAAPREIEDAAGISPDGLRHVVENLRQVADFAILDTGKGLHATDMLALQVADAVVLVAQMDVLSLHRTARLLRLLRGLDGVPGRIRLVLNRRGSAASEVGVHKVEEALGLPVVAEIPNAFRAFHKARSTGGALDSAGPGGRTLRAFADLARALGPTTPWPAAPAAPPSAGAPPAARPGWWPRRGGRAPRPAAG